MLRASGEGALLETRRGMALKSDLFKPQDFEGDVFADR